MAKTYKLEDVRNIGFIAHIDAGKTTTTEQVLFHTGRIHRVGGVDSGTATMDWMIQEKERGITIQSAATTCYWRDYEINIIDTPGHIDFTAEVERALRVLDGCVVIFDGVNGVEAQSESVWHQADRYAVPRLIFINKLDRIGSDYIGTINDIQKKLKANPLILQLPYLKNSEFEGVIDILKQKLYMWTSADSGKNMEILDVPEECKDQVKEYQEKLKEKLAEIDDALMHKFYHNEAYTDLEIAAAIRKGTISGKYFPILCGSSLKHKGTQPLLDAIVDYLPSPKDKYEIKGINPFTEKEEIRHADPADPFAALVFKVQTDPYVGRLAYIRIYSGTLKSGSSVHNSRKNKTERISRILKMHANEREEIKEAKAGDIVAVIGVKNTTTGETICDNSHNISFESITFPEPVIWVSVEPKTKSDQERLSYALRCLAEEDPSFRYRIDEETGQTIISGMGELHLDIIIDRIKREFSIDARIGKPQVAYRETIYKKVVEETKYVKQTGGRGQYGHVVLEIEPAKGTEFENKIIGGSIPREYIPAVEKGVKESMESGPLAGYPVINVKVTLVDGSYHEVDSSEIAFKMAASIAVNNGIRKASPGFLEPIMKIEVNTPEEFIGDVIADLNARRGKIESMEMRGALYHVKGFIPLAEMFGYATTLRSISRGRASYTMEPSHYEGVPKSIKEKLLPAVLV